MKNSLNINEIFINTGLTFAYFFLITLIPFAETIKDNSTILLGVVFGSMIGLVFAGSNKVIALTLFAFNVFITILAVLFSVKLGASSQDTILSAFILTMIIGIIAHRITIHTKLDSSNWRTPLLIMLFINIIFQLLDIFVFMNPIITLILSGITVVLFLMFLIYDIQRINKCKVRDANNTLLYTIAIFIYTLSIFFSLLNFIAN